MGMTVRTGQPSERKTCHIMKTPTACVNCRQGKRRCTAGQDEAACNECRRRGMPCSFAAKASLPSNERLILPQYVNSIPANLVTDSKVRLNLGQLYLSLIHDKPHTMFHPPALGRQLEDGSLPPKVMYGIFAMSSWYVDSC